MKTTQEIIREAQEAQSRPIAKWLSQLIADMTYRLGLEHRRAEGAMKRAVEEVTEARRLLTEGPADSDTFLDLPRALYTDAEDEQRPLGKGATIEFRGPGDEPGEGISVKWEKDHLKISGLNRLAVVPINTTTVHIEAR
jgi:hypothetical protein